MDAHHRNSLPMNRRDSRLNIPRIQIFVNDESDNADNNIDDRRGSFRGRKYSLHRNWPNPSDNDDDDDYYDNNNDNNNADYIEDINDYEMDEEDSDPRFDEKKSICMFFVLFYIT